MWSRRLVAAVLAGAAFGWVGIPGPVAAAPAGPAVAGQPAVEQVRTGPDRVEPDRVLLTEPRGWAPIFAETFNGPKPPSQCTAYNGPPGGQSATYYRPDEVQVSGGMLRLSIRRRNSGGRPYTAGGIGCYGLTQLYGRYEYRARAVPAVGVDSYVALWPTEGTETDATLIEIYTPSDQSPEPARARIANGHGQGIERKTAAGMPVDGFHEYQIEWSPTGIRITIDKRLVFTDTRTSAKARWLGFAVSTGDEKSGLPDQDNLPTEFLIDWIRVYSYQPGATGLPTSRSVGPSGGSEHRGQSVLTDRGYRLAAAAVLGVLAAILAGIFVIGRLRRGNSSHRA